MNLFVTHTNLNLFHYCILNYFFTKLLTLWCYWKSGSMQNNNSYIFLLCVFISLDITDYLNLIIKKLWYQYNIIKLSHSFNLSINFVAPFSKFFLNFSEFLTLNSQGNHKKELCVHNTYTNNNIILYVVVRTLHMIL